MKLYEPEVGDWVVCDTDGKTRLMVDAKLDGYVQLAPDMLFWHPSGLRPAHQDEIRKAQIEAFDTLVKAYRKQLFAELCRIKKWKKVYKKEADVPMKEANAMVRMGILPLHAAAKWNPL